MSASECPLTVDVYVSVPLNLRCLCHSATLYKVCVKVPLGGVSAPLTKGVCISLLFLRGLL